MGSISGGRCNHQPNKIMMGAEAILPAIVISIICFGIALFALCALNFGICLWRKRRGLSLVLLIPSALYLVLFLYFFVPRPLPHRILTIDLRRPTDLSGFPPSTQWLLAHWPPPKTIVPLSPDGASTDVSGKVDFSITLPDGQVLHDVGRECYINVDDTGVWKIEIWTDELMPEKALQNLKASLWPIVLSATNKGGDPKKLSEMENGLSTYAPKAPLYFDFRLAFPSYKLNFHLMPTVTPSEKVRYVYSIEVPHVEWSDRYKPLPVVDRPDELVLESRDILTSGTGDIVPKQNWPTSVSQIHPSSVYVKNGNVFLVFDCHGPATGMHCYAISLGNQPADDPQVHVISTPYPAITEVGVHQ
jgi:hypothetical protein